MPERHKRKHLTSFQMIILGFAGVILFSGGWGGLSGDIGEDWFPAGSGGGEASAVLSQG